MRTAVKTGMRNTCLQSWKDDLAQPLAGTDAELVRQMLNGSHRAWRELHARYDGLIQHCIKGVTDRFSSVLGADDVREIYAIFLMQLLADDMRRLKTFDPARGSRLGSWLGVIAARCAYDYLRVVKREYERGDFEEAEEVLCEMPDPHERVELCEREERLDGALGELSEKDREFVALYFGEGRTAAEIAERLQISVKTVYSKHHKIKNRLEAALADIRLAA